MKKKIFSVRKLTLMAILSAISAIVMLFEIPLWFAPSFYELDFSEVFILIGGFSMGPIAAVIIEFMKILINTLFTSTTTGYVGEFANFVIGCSFVVPASIIYKFNKSKKGAIIGLLFGVFVLGIIGTVINYFVLLPMYAELYKMPIEDFVSMGNEKNGNINSLFTLVMFATLPFNLLKGAVDSAIVFILYKKISPILHKELDK